MCQRGFLDHCLCNPANTLSDGNELDGGPLLLYLQHGAATTGETNDQSGASDIANEDFSVFVQDSWKLRRNFTSINGLRWEAQHFPSPFIPPSQDRL